LCAAAEHSPSSGLPSRHAAHNVVPDAAKDHPDGCPDATVLVAASHPVPDPLQADARPSVKNASDASVAARPAATADAYLALADEDVGKLAAREPAVPEQAASSHLATAAVRASVEALCTPDAVPSAEQSCAVQASSAGAVLQLPEVRAP